MCVALFYFFVNLEVYFKFLYIQNICFTLVNFVILDLRNLVKILIRITRKPDVIIEFTLLID